MIRRAASANGAELDRSPVPGVTGGTPHVQWSPDSSPPPAAGEPPDLRPAAVEPRETPDPPASGPEPSGARFARRAHRVRLYLYAFLAVALLVYVVALARSNTHRVRVDWVFGHSSVSLVWLVLLAVILGWLLGLMVAAVFRWRTRAPGPR
jgi:uncharacterized integral membrane protein